MLIKIMFHYIKDYFKKKDAYVLLRYTYYNFNLFVVNKNNKNEFEILDVLNESCLLFCSYIIMLALLFAN